MKTFSSLAFILVSIFLMAFSKKKSQFLTNLALILIQYINLRQYERGQNINWKTLFILPYKNSPKTFQVSAKDVVITLLLLKKTG